MPPGAKEDMWIFVPPGAKEDMWKFVPPGAKGDFVDICAARGMMVYRRVTPEGSWTVTRPKKSLQI